MAESTSVRIPVETFELENGLFVTLSEDHSAPIVAVNLWYHVGSANEREGRTGFAHLFEHMLFQGSENVEANEHFELIQRAGGTLNGSTWLERTNYYETLPSHQLALALWLEADRMGRLLPAMTQEKLDTQRSVVKNERRWSVDNQPYGTWWEKLPELAFPESHPFHHSLIGSFEDLDAASLADISEFFAMYYTPDNAVLSVAGDFDAEEARRLIRDYFGGIPRGRNRPPLRSTAVDTVFGKELRRIVPDDVNVPRAFLAFRAPPFGSDGYYAASVCGAILGMKKGSILYRSLVRKKQVATEVSAFTFDLTKGRDLLICDVTARAGITGAELEKALTAEIDSVVKSGVSKDDVARAVALICTDLAISIQSATDRADKLSMFATYFRKPEMINEQIANYQAVTVDEVNRFIKDGLINDNRALLLYVPRSEDGQ
jgi:predicted Zn-dependent peptidase